MRLQRLLAAHLPLGTAAVSTRAEEPPIPDLLVAAAEAQQACDAAWATGRKVALMAVGGPSTACFAGQITPESADGFLALPIPDGACLVLRSGGGDMDRALDMAAPAPTKREAEPR